MDNFLKNDRFYFVVRFEYDLRMMMESGIDKTVVYSNDLVRANYHLSVNEMRLILIACSLIDSKKKACGAIFISNQDFERSFGLETNNRTYENLKNAAKSLIRNPIKLFDSDSQQVIELVWLLSNKYDVGSDGAGVTIQFSPLIEPYLFEIKQRFTAIDFEIAAKLNTVFSLRLYQWLKEAENKPLHQRQYDSVELILEVDWMKEQAQLVGSYPKWNDFNNRVIKPAISKINAVSDLSVVAEPTKKGKKINSVKFTFVKEHTPSFSKPIRPRLFRRPKVKKGSHEEGVWMRKNLDLLMNYAKELKAYDSKAKMDLADLRKMAEYASIYDNVLENILRKEIAERTNKAA